MIINIDNTGSCLYPQALRVLQAGGAAILAYET